ncbi:hydantoinase B/oxoprolinase family protein [Chloroflexota bacterium]
MPIDTEVIQRKALETPTELESKRKDSINPDEFAIYSTKLELICEEAKQVLVNTGISTGAQAADVVAGIYTGSGDLAIACAGTYLHVATGVIPIKYILKHFKNDPMVGINDGDIFFCNEAIYGGIHNPDMLNIVPIFWEGNLIAWAAVAVHEMTTGSIRPGGSAPDARNRYGEGLKVPPLKVGADFQLKTDVVDTLVNMVEDEHQMAGDMKARSAAAFKVRERVLEILQDKGAEFFAGLLRKILEVSAEGAKKRIGEFNDGIYRNVMFFDMRGDIEALGCIHINLVKKGEKVLIDVTGASPYTESYLNAKPHIVMAHFFGELMMGLFADFPVSSGLLTPFEIRVPENTIINAPNHAAVGGSVKICQQVVGCINACLNKMIYSSDVAERVTTGRAVSKNFIGGGLNQYGKAYGYGSVEVTNACGTGATPYHDGMDAASFWWSGYGDALDIEQQEIQYPYLYLFRKKPVDQCGFGKFRGGTGVSCCILFHNSPGQSVFSYSAATSRMIHEHGLFGGYTGGMSPAIEIRGVNWRELFEQRADSIPYEFTQMMMQKEIPTKLTQFITTPFSDGEGIVWIGGSSAGYGDVLERDPEMVLHDLNMGVISLRTVNNVYCVALDKTGSRIDLARTKDLRNEERARRRARGKPYKEFEHEWLKKRPEEEQLRLYGPWPWGIEHKE